MSDPEQKLRTEIDAVMRAQEGLVEAHLALVRMQQSLLAGLAPGLPPGAEARPIKTAQVTPPEALAAGRSELLPESRRDEAGFEGTGGGGLPPTVPDNQAGDGPFLARYGISVILPVLLGLTVLALLFRSPHEVTDLQNELSAQREQQADANNRISEALKKTEAELTATQEKLKQTQAALGSNEQALRQAQQALAEAKGAPPPAPAPSAEAAPATPEQLLARGQRELRNARSALVANQRDLIKNLAAYRTVARTLALNRRSLAQIELNLRVAKGEISPQEGARQLKPWQDYLPPEAVPLMDDRRLETEAAAAVPAAEGGSQGREEEVPARLPEIQALLVKTVTELKATMKELTDTQASITQAESDLTATQAEQARVQEVLLKAQRNPPTSKVKPAAPSSAADATRAEKSPTGPEDAVGAASSGDNAPTPSPRADE